MELSSGNRGHGTNFYKFRKATVVGRGRGGPTQGTIDLQMPQGAEGRRGGRENADEGHPATVEGAGAVLRSVKTITKVR